MISLVSSPEVVASDGDDVNARRFSVIKLVDALGYLVGVPIMTVAWVRGIDAGGSSLGLPFFISAVSGSRKDYDDSNLYGQICYILAAALLWKLYS